MPGIVVLSSRNASPEMLDKVIRPLLYEDFHKVEKFVQPGIACARIHLGHFNPQPQPIFNEDRSLAIFMDGRVYGYEKEMEELKQRGHKFAIGDDPEFCLHAYEEYGKEFIKHLNGAFVFAILNLKTGQVLVVNDRYGFRVHHFACEGNSFYFTPEAKGILQVPGFKKELNEEAVAEYFALGEFWSGRTFFKGVNALPPASILTFDGAKKSIEQYWEFHYEPDYKKSEKEFVDELVKTLSNATKRRLESNLRHGVTLSGGLDSRSVLASVPDEARKNIRACTFGSEDCDETMIARQVTRAMAVKEHKIYNVNANMLLKNAKKEIWHTEGSCTMGVAFGNPILKQFREHADIIFDGYAMDLTLGGSYLKNDYLSSQDDSKLKELLRKKRLFADEELAQLLSSKMYDKVKDVPKKSFDDEYAKVKSKHPGNRSDEFAMKTHVTQNNVGDISVRNFIEIAHPSSDNEFLDLLLKIPPEWRLDHRIYRKFLIKLSPEMANIKYNTTMVKPKSPIFMWKLGLIYNFGKELLKKKLFSLSRGKINLRNRRSYVDYDGWFKHDPEWKAFFEALILSRDSHICKYLNQEYVRKLYHEQASGKKNNVLKLFQIANFEMFLRLFFNEKQQSK